ATPCRRRVGELLEFPNECLQLLVAGPVHELEPPADLPRLPCGRSSQCLVFLEGGPEYARSLEDDSVQLLCAFLQRTRRLLEPFPGGLQFHVSQLLLDCGLALDFLFFSQPLLSDALLLRPELLLHQALLGEPTPLVRPKILFDGVNSSPLFRRTPL